MPATYAHYAFGQQMLPLLPAELQEAARRCSGAYHTGLHGPDPLFYYNPFFSNPVQELASFYHHIPGREVFTQAVRRWREQPGDSGLAYLSGLLTHYCLDSVCHPLVNDLAQKGECGHSELETEFDRFLMEQNGILKPHRRDLGAHIRLSREECAQAALCYPPLTPRQMGRSIRSMTLFTRVLSGRTIISRELLELSLPYFGETVRHHLMPRKGDPRLMPLNERLMELYRRSCEKFPALARKLSAHITEAIPLDEDFDPIMG